MTRQQAAGKGQLQLLLAMIQRAKAKVGFCCSTRLRFEEAPDFLKPLVGMVLFS